MNSSLLRSIMALFGDTNKSLADYLGLTEQTMSKKIYEKCQTEKFTYCVILTI